MKRTLILIGALAVILGMAWYMMAPILRDFFKPQILRSESE